MLPCKRLHDLALDVLFYPKYRNFRNIKRLGSSAFVKVDGMSVHYREQVVCPGAVSQLSSFQSFSDQLHKGLVEVERIRM